MTTIGLWDLSGQEQKKYSLPSGTKNETTRGTEATSGGGTTTTSGTTNFSARNTPNFALNSLEQLVMQLSDRPNLSGQDATQQFPDPVRKYEYVTSGRGIQEGRWIWIDPLTNMPVSEDRVNALKTQRAQQRLQAQQASGVTTGGTAETQRSTAQRQEEIVRNRTQQSAYSKEAAFADALALTDRFTRQLLEQIAPQITRAAESSGTSGGAVRGLLMQDAAARVAETQAALGLQTAVQYGQLSNQLAPVLELLTRESNPVLSSLMQALGISKGTINEGSQSTSQTSVENKTSNTNKQADSDLIQQALPQLLQPLINDALNNSRPATRYEDNNSTPYMDIRVNRPESAVAAQLESFTF